VKYNIFLILSYFIPTIRTNLPSFTTLDFSMLKITADEVNFIIYQYLNESGTTGAILI